jgi:hypothetical protein
MITDTRADGTGNAMAGVVPDGPISGVLAQNWWVTCSISCADAWIWEANPLAASTNDHGAVPDIKPPEFVSLFGWGPFLRPGLHNRKRRAQWRSRLAAGHRQRRRAAVLTAASTAQCSIGPGPSITFLPGSWFFPRSGSAATWHRGGWHRYVPNAINFVRSVATPDSRLPSLVPAGTCLRLDQAELGSFCDLLVLTPRRERRPSGIRCGRSRPGA